jgi:DNA-binding transcriptional ArsR family regulator
MAKKKSDAGKFSDEQIKTIVSAMEVAKDGTRVRILAFVEDGEKFVGEIADYLGMSQPSVSHHLSVLRHSGMIESVRTGKNNFYSPTNRGRTLIGLFEDLVQ